MIIPISDKRKGQLHTASLKHRYSYSYWAMALRNKALQRAKNKQLEFSISKDFIIEKLVHGHCEASNLRLDLSGGSRKPLTPSLDRKDPSKGYTEDNVQLVCWIYNSAKSTFKHEDVLMLAQALSKENVWQ